MLTTNKKRSTDGTNPQSEPEIEVDQETFANPALLNPEHVDLADDEFVRIANDHTVRPNEPKYCSVYVLVSQLLIDWNINNEQFMSPAVCEVEPTLFKIVKSVAFEMTQYNTHVGFEKQRYSEKRCSGIGRSELRQELC